MTQTPDEIDKPIDLRLQSCEATPDIEIEHLDRSACMRCLCRHLDPFTICAHRIDTSFKQFDNPLSRQRMRFGQSEVELGIFDGVTFENRLEARSERGPARFGDRVA